MALQLDSIVLESGITVDSSYVRVDTISGSKDSLLVTVNYYVSQNSFNDGKSYIKSEQFSFIPSVEDGSANFIKQAYEFLKKRPEFTNAVDVLDL